MRRVQLVGLVALSAIAIAGALADQDSGTENPRRRSVVRRGSRTALPWVNVDLHGEAAHHHDDPTPAR